MRPALILVGADKGGVGKTTVSRILLDYLAERRIPVRMFDTEWPRGTLARFYSGETEIVDLARISDQMRIFDTLDVDNVKVSLVDVRAGQLKTIMTALREFGFYEAVREGRFDFLLFHILGSSVASLEEIAEIAPFVADAQYFLVKNYVGEGTYFEWDPKLHRAYFDRARGATQLTIPKLNDLAIEQIDYAGATFSGFVSDPKNSFVLRGYVRSWRHSVASQLDDAAVGGAFGRDRPEAAIESSAAPAQGRPETTAPPAISPLLPPEPKPETTPAQPDAASPGTPATPPPFSPLLPPEPKPGFRPAPPVTPAPAVATPPPFSPLLPPEPKYEPRPSAEPPRREEAPAQAGNGPALSRLDEISEMLLERLRALDKVTKGD